ncbi:MAG: LytR C-terminal domain-containing protein [Parcubacteria group bacterium]|nr:LytR C-terminal domain-containing protein [Parcubacteria group bacterium]
MFIGVLAVGGYYLFDKPTPEEKAREELAAAMASVGELMILPEGDEPVLATVTDAETLIKQQAFFTGAVNGDQLLLFPRNLKAVLYSPSRKMIVNMGPIQQQPQVAVGNDQIPSAPEGDASRPYGAGKSQTNPNDSEQILLEFNGASQNSNIQNETANSASVPQGSAILTAEIRNGTGKNGLASQIAEQISGNAGYKVLKVTDAHKKDYSETLVVNKNRDVEKLQLVNSLIAALGGRAASELPSGEKDTEADILVILGGN